MSRTSPIDPAPAGHLAGGGHLHDFHEHSHDHAHDPIAPGMKDATLRAASLLGRSAIGRLAYLSLLLATLWASVFWALH
jgi:hypothetical protein